MPKIAFLTKFIYLSASTIIHPRPHLMIADFSDSEADRLIRHVNLADLEESIFLRTGSDNCAAYSPTWEPAAIRGEERSRQVFAG
ncbi:hypothetical protein [Sphingobium yanoikuyae]|uniref:hypothetical protein n=1 Tax=Sphingobium yanoikuyae TaxID=13690 RepID=UPI0035AD800D